MSQIAISIVLMAVLLAAAMVSTKNISRPGGTKGLFVLIVFLSIYR